MGQDKFQLQSRYMIPFSYQKQDFSFDSLVGLEEESVWELEEKGKQESDIYEYIMDSILSKENQKNSDRAQKIACMYRYRKLKQNFEIIYKKNEQIVKIMLRAVHLILFQSGIGILWYEVEPRTGFKNAEEAISFTYDFKELARSEKQGLFFLESVISADPIQKEYLPFSMGVWIRDILDTLPTTVSFYPSRKMKERDIPDKALLFHHCIMQEENLERTAYYLTRGYKETYHYGADAFSEMFQPFDNVRIYATSEGCGYYALATEDNMSFFYSAKKTLTDYFWLYVLLVYQSYTLLMFSERISQGISANTQDYKYYSVSTIEELEDFTLALNVFLAKCTYSSVSHVQHQNEFYEYVSKKLHIQDNVHCVSEGIDALKALEEKMDEEEKQKKNGFLEGSIYILSLLALISAFTDANDFSINYLRPLLKGEQPNLVYLLNGLVLFCTIIVVVLIIRYLGMKRRRWMRTQRHKKAVRKASENNANKKRSRKK